MVMVSKERNNYQNVLLKAEINYGFNKNLGQSIMVQPDNSLTENSGKNKNVDNFKNFKSYHQFYLNQKNKCKLACI